MKCFYSLIILYSLPLLLTGCNEPAKDREITEIRIVPPEERAAPPLVSNQERLGLLSSGSAHPRMSLSQETEEPLFRWEVPPTWKEGPEQSMRLVTLMPEESQASECYVSRLGGAAGGLEANINRWGQQIGLPPLSEEEIAALPRIPLLDTEATLVDMEGLLVVQGGQELPVRVYGLVCPLEGTTLFVKMTGPAEELQDEKENFESFVSSIAFAEGGRS
ncbi:MAG: hypothetical protein GX130_10105 [Candidatus Hydrogenedens sp.]|nr:hypothetical protein [Candidatus Hydrogenedens sp.]